MKRFFLIVLCLLSHLIYAQKGEIDSLKNRLISTTSINEKVDLLNELSYLHRTFDLESAHQYVTEAHQLASGNSYLYGLAKVQYVSATLLMDIGQNDSAILLFQQALQTMISLDKTKDIENIYNNLGISFKRSGNRDSSNFFYQKALSYVDDDFGRARLFSNLGSNYISAGLLDSAAIVLHRALKIFENLEAHQGLTITYLNLGNIHYKKDDFEWALTYYKASLKSAIISKHKPVQSRCYLNIGSIFSINDNLDSGMFYFQKAVTIQESMNDQPGIAATYRNMGEAFLIKDRLQLAEKYFLKSRDIYQAVDHSEGQIRINKFLANLYLKSGDYTNSEKYIARSVALSRTDQSTHELQKSLALQHEILNKSNNYKGAYAALLEEKKISDSLFTETKVKQVNELRTQYDTEKKEAEIASLSQETAIQQLEIKQKNQFMIIGVIMVLLIISIAYLKYRQQALRKQQTQVELEQRFLRSQLNPHFISNALTAVQSFMLNNQTVKAASYLAKFSKLMREILENSRHEFILVEDELKMLTNFMDIHKIRMNDAFDYVINVDENIDPETDTIPPMFVQPFIENAIEHGVNNAKQDGLIELSFVKEGNYISIVIKDNGEGLKTNVQKAEDHTSLSTTIIKERMALFNKSLKNKIQVLLSDYTNEQKEVLGTQVELKVPFGYL